MTRPALIVTLRERLRADTRAAHDAVDRAFGRFDLTSRDGLTSFLRAQRAGLAALHGAGATCAGLREGIGAIDADLASLGAEPPAAAAPAPTEDHPIAQDYLWLGSRLGTRMLARRWADATDPDVRRASAYLGMAADPAPWRAFTARAEEMSARGPEADLIVTAAIAWFALFEQSALTGGLHVPAE
ncbi:biliverdin-producing heme oxygenase [Jannaschia aquimarina]|uniref:Heme oxygenase n=1 Tax=Jannaschia aquimarina TaxID=935700 RepID=A0A0D1EIS4_9RHOB|nr:biliverdin-producing heme oxygenase [Jannaschia aquimarina]KIT17534.1 hypothetical protein jaqu_07230 [Jannaschia aquimarina]SNS73514.1 Heme oxygenase [Jannaschia aquimarina]